MKHLAHYVGIGRKVSLGLQYLDSEPETCRVLAMQLIRGANAVAHLAVIRSETVDFDPTDAANILVAMEALTGFASTLADEAEAIENEVLRQADEITEAGAHV